MQHVLIKHAQLLQLRASSPYLYTGDVHNSCLTSGARLRTHT